MMKSLDILLPHLNHTQVWGNSHCMLDAICIDSRKAKQGAAFIAIKGTNQDGHDYIDQVIDAGVRIIICEQKPITLREDCCYILVSDSSKAAGQLANAFYDFPSKNMTIVGVTGTNGKTTVSTLLFQLFTQLGYPCGLLSTVQNIIIDKTLAATHTTPDAPALQELLAQMRDAGCTHIFMEVSSHAIHQNRIEGIDFDGALFTNISHDHLDYHKTFEEYIQVKKHFFDMLPSNAFALSNTDDKRGMVMLQNTKAQAYTYSLRNPATIKGKVLENNLTGLVMELDGYEIHFRMIGTFNAYNLMAVYGAAKFLGQDPIECLQHLSNLQGAEGRFESIISGKDNILGIIDYAHTPDALLNVLNTIQQLRKQGEQLITVVGCGGDRDKSKRPLMAEIAAEKSDRILLTSDNPRTEDPEQILNEMEAGLSISHKRKTLRISDRKEAIKAAVSLAQAGDVILIAGKGHEKYQEVAGVRHPFDDKAILKEIFNLFNK